MKAIISKLIKAGVKNMKEFGYAHCDESNILTDEVYGMFFENMLNENKGNGVDAEINELLFLIKQNRK